MKSGEKLNKLKTPYVWAFTTYFAEGFPYTIIRIISSVFFRDTGMSLRAIGLTSLYGIPWVLKFLWGPYIDEYATKRTWMLLAQGTLFLLIGLISILAATSWGIKAIALVLLIGSIVAATHDMAIDGYYMEALDDKGQAKFVGYRVMAYRIAMMTGTGIVVTLGTTLSWTTAYTCSAAMLAVLFLYHLIFLPSVETHRKPYVELLARLVTLRLLIGIGILASCILIFQKLFMPLRNARLVAFLPILGKIAFSDWVAIGLLLGLVSLGIFKNKIKALMLGDKTSFYARAFIAFMDRERMGTALTFIILMRTGESMLASMVSPFIVDLGIKVHYGWISGGVGLPFSIVGAMVGGWLIARYSMKKTIWPFLIAQNFTNLIYMALAFHFQHFVAINTGALVPTPLGAQNIILVACVHAFDQFAGGLGTSILVTYLMRTCIDEFKAAHFAIGSGLMNISGVLAGVASGFLAQWLGYGTFFGISFCASVPGMLLIPFIPFLEEPS